MRRSARRASLTRRFANCTSGGVCCQVRGGEGSVEIETAGAERRPFIKVTAEGKPYLLVHTRRGPRARQVAGPGWAWIREKYPADTYPSLEDTPLTYDDYRQLWQDGFIGTYSGPPKPPRRRAAGGTTTSPRPTAPWSPPTPGGAAGGRPLMHHSVHQLERMFRAARSQRAVLQQLRGELRRRRSQRAQALLATVEAALRAQDVRPREPACRMCDAAGPDAGRFCPGCGRVRPQSDHRAVRPAVPVRDAVPAAAPPAPAVTSPPAPPPRTEAPWVSNGVLVVAIIAVVVILVVYRMVVLQR